MTTTTLAPEIRHTDNAVEGQKQWTVDAGFFFWTYRSGIVFSSDNWNELLNLMAFDMRFQKRYHEGGVDWYFVPANKPTDIREFVRAAGDPAFQPW